jgi:hypothetical protein
MSDEVKWIVSECPVIRPESAVQARCRQNSKGTSTELNSYAFVGKNIRRELRGSAVPPAEDE